MLVVDYQTMQSHLADYCDQVSDHNEEVHVTRMGDQDMVMISLAQYRQLEEALHNLRRLEEIQTKLDQTEAKKGQAYDFSAFDILRQSQTPQDPLQEKENRQGIVIISLAQYQELAKALRNFRYLNMIQDGIDELHAGNCQTHKLIETED